MKTLLLLLAVVWLCASACSQQPEGPGTEVAPGADPAAPGERLAGVAFYDVGAGPRAIAVADFNGDSRPDAAVANAADGTVTVLSGDAAGKFSGSASFEAGREPADVDAVDLDRDGDVDLVVANHETSNVTVLVNDGHGRFAPATGSPFDTGARPHVHGLATGDFDGDGWVDVAVESSDTKEVRVLRGGPDGLVAAVPVAVGTMPYSRLGVGDVGGLGRSGILVPGHGDNTVRAIENTGGALRESTLKIQLTAQPWMVAAGDLNGDGRDDLVVVETDAISVWLAKGDAFVREVRSAFSIPGATEAVIGDLDGDGAADLAVGPWDGDEVTVFVGRDRAARKVRMCERPIGLAISDLDGDGNAELLATCTKGNKLAVTTVTPR